MPVESKEELQKLTIPQLKDRLKQRRLQVTGTKPDLVNRLFDSLQDEENLLSGAAGGGGEELDVDADSLLEGHERPTVPMSSTEEFLLLGINPNKGAANGEATTTAKSATPTPKNSPVKPNPTSSPVKTAEEPKTDTSENTASTQNSQSENGEGDASKAAKPERPRISVSDIVGVDAKKRRAERFGLPVAANNNEKSQADKPAAEKTAEKAGEKKADGAEKRPAAQIDEKFLERAKRFGLPINEIKNGAGGGHRRHDGEEEPPMSSGEAQCPTCLESVATGAAVLKCGHQLHDSCLQSYLQTETRRLEELYHETDDELRPTLDMNARCPICREKIDS
ncbi:hypothetical protein M3Y99_00490200 [Aphelenchoides fujianensis]|nr:hypothetical protein M3Y99_00490200 [Aphelenchoides fujianensis]